MRRASGRVFLAGVLFLVAVLLAPPGFAGLVSLDDAAIVGNHFVLQTINSTGKWGDAETAYVGNCSELKRGDLLLGYYLPVYPKGYVILSLLTELPPIKAYSTSYTLDPASDEGFSQLLKDTMVATLDFLEAQYGNLRAAAASGALDMAAPAENQLAWERLLSSGDGPPDTATVGPILQSTWEQGAPFNDDCPEGYGGRTVVGCVATAAAQIMKYWEWPPAGVGSHSYYWNGDDSCSGGSTPGQTLSADFSDPYDWANMLNSYSGGYNAAQAAAVAELSYEVGVALEMDYGRCASGTWTDKVMAILPLYFRYADTISKHDREDYASAQDWFDRIRLEFDRSPPRPIQYRISGHSIVCDGYQTSGGINYVHMNYGWAGSQDNWYAVDNLYCPWQGCNYLVEYMLCGIQPQGGSCPLLYTWNGAKYVFEKHVVYGAVGPQREFVDKIVLKHAPAPGGYSFLLKEFHGEKSYLDQARIAVVVEGVVKPVVLSPAFAMHSRTGNALAALQKSDNQYVEMLPGDRMVINFPIPETVTVMGAAFIGEGFYVLDLDLVPEMETLSCVEE